MAAARTELAQVEESARVTRDALSAQWKALEAERATVAALLEKDRQAYAEALHNERASAAAAYAAAEASHAEGTTALRQQLSEATAAIEVSMGQVAAAQASERAHEQEAGGLRVSLSTLQDKQAATQTALDEAGRTKAEAAVKTAPAPVAAGVVAAAAAPPAVRSSAELAMAELIATGGAPPYGEAQMVAVSSGVADRADRAMLWQASMRLGQVPLDGAAAAAAAAGIPAVAEDASEFGPEMAHNLLMQFVCFSSSEPTPPESIYLSFTLFHFDARTTPRAILMPPEDAKAASARAAAVDSGSGASASTAARPDAIVVDVRELNLGPQRRDAPWGHVAVEIEIPGVDPPPPPAGGYRPGQPKPALVRSKNAPKRGRRVDLGFSHVFDTPPGSSAASALALLLFFGARRGLCGLGRRRVLRGRVRVVGVVGLVLVELGHGAA